MKKNYYLVLFLIISYSNIANSNTFSITVESPLITSQQTYDLNDPSVQNPETGAGMDSSFLQIQDLKSGSSPIQFCLNNQTLLNSKNITCNSSNQDDLIELTGNLNITISAPSDVSISLFSKMLSVNNSMNIYIDNVLLSENIPQLIPSISDITNNSNFIATINFKIETQYKGVNFKENRNINLLFYFEVSPSSI